jgi:hypothetical protein
MFTATPPFFHTSPAFQKGPGKGELFCNNTVSRVKHVSEKGCLTFTRDAVKGWAEEWG